MQVEVCCDGAAGGAGGGAGAAAGAGAGAGAAAGCGALLDIGADCTGTATGIGMTRGPKNPNGGRATTIGRRRALRRNMFLTLCFD